jgi:hypothetical protein
VNCLVRPGNQIDKPGICKTRGQEYNGCLADQSATRMRTLGAKDQAMRLW